VTAKSRAVKAVKVVRVVRVAGRVAASRAAGPLDGRVVRIPTSSRVAGRAAARTAKLYRFR